MARLITFLHSRNIINVSYSEHVYEMCCQKLKSCVFLRKNLVLHLQKEQNKIDTILQRAHFSGTVIICILFNKIILILYSATSNTVQCFTGNIFKINKHLPVIYKKIDIIFFNIIINKGM